MVISELEKNVSAGSKTKTSGFNMNLRHKLPTDLEIIK